MVDRLKQIGKYLIALSLTQAIFGYLNPRSGKWKRMCWWFEVFFFINHQYHVYCKLNLSSVEWVSDCFLTPTQQLFSLIVNEMMMRSALYLTNTLSWIFIVLAHWNNSPQIDMSHHSDTLSWFRANQYVLFLLHAVWLAEKQQIPIVFGLTNQGIVFKTDVYFLFS